MLIRPFTCNQALLYRSALIQHSFTFTWTHQEWQECPQSANLGSHLPSAACYFVLVRINLNRSCLICSLSPTCLPIWRLHFQATWRIIAGDESWYQSVFSTRVYSFPALNIQRKQSACKSSVVFWHAPHFRLFLSTPTQYWLIIWTTHQDLTPSDSAHFMKIKIEFKDHNIDDGGDVVRTAEAQFQWDVLKTVQRCTRKLLSGWL